MCLKSKPEEGADVPFGIMYGEAFLVADVGEIIYHRDTAELVVPLTNYGTAAGDYYLGEVIVEWYAGVTKSHRCVAIDDECGKGG